MKKIILTICIVILFILGATYAWFNYYKAGDDNILIAGDIKLLFGVTGNGINITGIFPETKEEARARNDNYIDFSINGTNTTGKIVYYEIYLNEGEEIEGKERFNPSDLAFDLIELGPNNSETIILDEVGFNDLNNHKIYADIINKETDVPITRNYRLRMWLSKKVTIGKGNVTYDQDDYQNYYASVKIAVGGDLNKKVYPLTYELEETLNNFSLNLSNGFYEGEEVGTINDTVELKISSTDSNVKFNASYVLPNPNDEEEDIEVTRTNQASIDETISYTVNEIKNITMEVKNASRNGSDIYFEVIKNGVTVEKFIKTVYRSASEYNILQHSLLEIPNIASTVTQIEFVNKTYTQLENEFDLNDSNVYDLTLEDSTGKYGDVRGKLSGTTLTIASEGKTYLSSGHSLFYNFTNLTSIDFTNVDTSLVKSMQSMFNGCTSLTTFDLSNFDTSNVTTMYLMFSNCWSLTSIDVTNFDTSNVTTMYFMFKNCSSLTSIDVTNFNTSNVTTMQGMFRGCSALGSLDLTSFNTSNVQNMRQMFYNCSSLNSVDLSSFNTGNVTSMAFMFYMCGSLSSLNLTNFDTINVTAMENMFYGCDDLTSLNLSNFDTRNVTTMKSMFEGCTSLTSLNVSGFNTKNVTDMSYMFKNIKVSVLDLSSFDTSKVTTTTHMFILCSDLTTIYASELWSNSSNTSSTNMFYKCNSLSGPNGTTYSYTRVSVTYARIDNPPDSPGYFTYKALSNSPS